MNILYIHSHDTGRYVQPYGYAVPTPNIQKLAEGGVLFRQAFCAAPTCSPSRAGLLTGCYPHQCGMFGLAHRGFSFRDYSQHLVHTLKKAGYTTALFGVQHEAKDANTLGYDRLDVSRDNTEGNAAAFLESKPAQPFFLSVGFHETHRVFPEPEVDARYVQPPGPLPDTPETRTDMAAYITMAGQLDRRMGVVFDALERSGLADDTLVICTTDHGIAFPTMKCNLTDHGTGVMLIMRGPSCGFTSDAPCGGVVDAMVSHIDVFPTICELANIEPPNWLEGRSLRPLVDGSSASIRDEVFAEVTYHAGYEPMRSVRTTRWKYIEYFDDRDKLVACNVDDGSAKSLLMDHGWAERRRHRQRLYDLVFDPNEACNLAASPDHAQVLAEMRQRLERWMRDTDDPLLAGPVPAPSGAIVNHPDSRSPTDSARTVVR